MTKPILLLDLDNTLLHSINKEYTFFSHISQFDHAFDIVDYSSKFKKIHYTCVERPGLSIFLEFCFKHFTVGIWTAANKHYTTQIVQECFTNRGYTPQFILTNVHVELSKFTYDGVKNLEYILENKDHLGIPEVSLESIIIIDDSISVKNTNGECCISCSPFYIYKPASVTGNTTKLEFVSSSVDCRELERLMYCLITRFNI